MPAQTVPLPRHARIWARVRPGDFLDTYSVATPLSARQALELALRSPGWARALLRLRDTLVAPLGLRTAASDEHAGFPVEYEDEDEIIVGMDDRHLDFRITVLKAGGLVHLSTWVHRNNALGHFYLALIKPFHVLILKSALRRIAAQG
ncbi:DUF2867 domain-containing protein [Pseudodonghicola flavimaris]|uniref:DUF2867 domain-containing protein n=1 Tax=Pseudodonghicola flavimaris TaxID=3050036 RepID=A0ABT7F079_9RHOB|nr:DUF2867 domain-containing protein [Pseudodonghicola flavimaris]MDK3018016.1 DUF2867 domain-containing protein [Pseudodonghicola flavimaris]